MRVLAGLGAASALLLQHGTDAPLGNVTMAKEEETSAGCTASSTASYRTLLALTKDRRRYSQIIGTGFLPVPMSTGGCCTHHHFAFR